MGNISQADFEYYNGAIRQVTTASSVLVSSSPYLNRGDLRELIGQEMLRRNGADLPITSFIPQLAQIYNELEDMPKVFQLFEEEKQRLPEFRRWLDERKQSNFTPDELKGCAPGTLGALIHDFLVGSGYQLDLFYQGLKVDSDFTFYLKERAYTHDIEHLVTGFEPNHAGEIALIAANMRGFYGYFRPELAAFFNRISSFLRARAIMRASLFYPESFKVELEAEDMGAAQGRNWKMPLMLLPWRDLVDRPLDEIRAEYGITNVPTPGYWSWTNAVNEEPRIAAE